MQGRCYYAHFTNEKTEATRDDLSKVAGLVTEARFATRHPHSKSCSTLRLPISLYTRKHCECCPRVRAVTVGHARSQSLQSGSRRLSLAVQGGRGTGQLQAPLVAAVVGD